jgi:hypothetical protein
MFLQRTSPDKLLSFAVTFFGRGKNLFDLCMGTRPLPNNFLLGFTQVAIEAAFANPGNSWA